MLIPLLFLACAEDLRLSAPSLGVDEAEAAWGEALAALVTPAGRVRYGALPAHQASLDAYVAALAPAWEPLDDDARDARLINAYNALVIKAVADQGLTGSVQDVQIFPYSLIDGASFFAGLHFQLNGETTNLYDLEHDVLRPTLNDARLHGALNCASEGCPPLRASLYPAEGLDAALTEAASRFVAERARIEGDEAVLSEIFDWFEDDFLAEADSLCAWAARVDPSYGSLAEAGCPHRFEPYDWTLNNARPPPALAPAPAAWTLPAADCPPGMVYVPPGTYTTGMKPPIPYGVVDTTQMAVVDAPERGCEAAIRETPGASACWVQTDLKDPVVPLHEVTLTGACVERLPFPGGGLYTPDGLTPRDVALMEELLRSGIFGPRRLCTFSELEVAAAGPTQNLRFLTGDAAEPQRCAADESVPIGERPLCQNPETGLGEYGAVISQWVIADLDFAKSACPPGAACLAAGGRPMLNERGEPNVRYVVAGGTRRAQTRQAPLTPHTWHDHGDPGGQAGCESFGWDDGPAVCADPDPRYRACAEQPEGEGCLALAAAEANYEAWRLGCQNGTMTDCLSRGLSVVVGDDWRICREPLGPGQGL